MKNNNNNNNSNNDHLADELGVVNDVELLPGEQLLPTDKAGEALQVENLGSDKSSQFPSSLSSFFSS